MNLLSNRVANEWSNLSKEVIASKSSAGFKKILDFHFCNNRGYIIIIIGFSVYLHNSPGDITQFNNKSMQKTEKF